jgi:hypothetical protein
MKKIISTLVFILTACIFSPGEDATFHVRVPNLKGKQAKALLVFSDARKSLDIGGAKRNFATIDYGQIDRFSYEYTKEHRIKQGALLMPASATVGAIVMLTKSKSHWLEIDYHDADIPKSLVFRMDKHDYLCILDALKAHTGKDAEILGDADKGEK